MQQASSSLDYQTCLAILQKSQISGLAIVGGQNWRTVMRCLVKTRRLLMKIQREALSLRREYTPSRTKAAAPVRLLHNQHDTLPYQRKLGKADSTFFNTEQIMLMTQVVSALDRVIDACEDGQMIADQTADPERIVLYSETAEKFRQWGKESNTMRVELHDLLTSSLPLSIQCGWIEPEAPCPPLAS